MSLKDWEQINKWLMAHQPTNREIADLLAVVDRDLHESGAEGLGADWRMTISYNAALQAATAALAAAGYRASRGDHHYRVIQSLALTVGWDPTSVGTLDAFRKKRNISGYERIGLVSDRDAQEMHDLAERLRDDVVRWLRKNHSGLM